ncbi:esterase/lipase family protein [Nocardia sp. alder85J]|uniref:esterase/lipase family protein n=1 Tax=Nocardia sp. alder85J TaxID=2862949 RepID=UPI001CD69BCA|nr:alpha/beta fold hydrolase [Nocardia sp. alder85J]MCX4091233.1 alpha/beta fold hydrolase [Nocardia sp. alder85J]
MPQIRGRCHRYRSQRWIAVAIALICALQFGSAVATADPGGSDDYRAPVVPAEPGPPQTEHLGAARYLAGHRNVTPQGTNNFHCTPSAAHPNPVVLAHGTGSSAYSDWAAIGPELAGAGFCVFALNYGSESDDTDFGSADIHLSARQLAAFVGDVLTATGAKQVDLVGFSQGAVVTRYYVNKLGGAARVRQWVGLASPTYGGTLWGLVPVANAVPPLWWVVAQFTSTAVIQQADGSPFMQELNAGGDTVAGVRYTTIGSRVDEMIQPFENIALRGPGAENIVLQDRCPVDLTGHFHLVYDPYVQQLLINTLDPAHAREPDCVVVPLGTGIPDAIVGAHWPASGSGAGETGSSGPVK